MPKSKPKKMQPKPTPKATRVTPKPAAKPQPPPPKRFLVRCTFVGELQKERVDGSFRFLVEGADAGAALTKLAPAVKKLRRAKELPPRCEVYVEFVLELADLGRGVVADFERWGGQPKRFQHGCIAFSDTCTVHQQDPSEPTFRFGQSPAASVGSAATAATPVVSAPWAPS